MEAPEGSPYKGGIWLLYVKFPEDYPLSAPEIRFVTPVRHCNVNQYGKICHSIFTRNWTADTSLTIVLSCIYGLLLNPDVDDPLDTGLALQYFAASGQYEASIMQHVAKYSTTKSRQEWAKEILNEVTESEKNAEVVVEPSSPSTSTTPVAQTTPVSKWFYHDISWIKYKKVDSDAIEKAYVAKEATVPVVGGLYSVNINLRSQTKKSTHFERKIVRGTWFWREDDGGYQPFSDKAAALLETAFQAGKFDEHISIGDGVRYCILCEDGTGKQFRIKGPNASGRAIIRGYRGRTIKDSSRPSKRRKMNEDASSGGTEKKSPPQ